MEQMPDRIGTGLLVQKAFMLCLTLRGKFILLAEAHLAGVDVVLKPDDRSTEPRQRGNKGDNDNILDHCYG